MNDQAKEVIGLQVARDVAQRLAALEILRERVRPVGVMQYLASAIALAIPGSYLGQAGFGNGGLVLGAALGCAISIGLQAAIQSHQLRKRLEAAITLLLQETKDVA